MQLIVKCEEVTTLADVPPGECFIRSDDLLARTALAGEPGAQVAVYEVPYYLRINYQDPHRINAAAGVRLQDGGFVWMPLTTRVVKLLEVETAVFSLRL